MRTINIDGTLKPLLNQNSDCRRQDMPPFYRVNGCIYINKIVEIDENTSFNDNKLGFVMEMSHSVDIDEYRDIALVDYYLSEKANQA